MRRLHHVAVRFLPGTEGALAPAALRRAARGVLKAEDVSLDAEVEAVVADAATVQDLNRLYRGRDEPTDVLSFADREGEQFIEAPGESYSLGQIVVCLPVAQRQAAEAGRPLEGEVAHLLVHGLLHVLGYDHEDDGESEAMKEREDQVLIALGYAGQYAHGH